MPVGWGVDANMGTPRTEGDRSAAGYPGEVACVAAERLRGSAGGERHLQEVPRRRRDPPQLHGRALVVAVGPVLDHLAVLDPHPMRLCRGEPFAGGRHGLGDLAIRTIDREHAGVPTRHCVVDDDEVALGDDVMDLESQLVECAAQPQRRGVERLRASSARCGRLVFGLPVVCLGVDELLELVERSVGHDLHRPDAQVLGRFHRVVLRRGVIRQRHVIDDEPR